MNVTKVRSPAEPAGEKPTTLPMITVAICTRNRAQSFKKAVESLLPQLDSSTELLIVDSASSDSTPLTAETFCRTHPLVRYHRESVYGIPQARNAALQKARGDYVIFFDDDEIADPDWLAVYKEFFLNPPSEKVACAGGPYIARQEIPQPIWLEANYGSFDLGGERRRLTEVTSPGTGNCGYSRSVALSLGGFSEAMFRREDSEFNNRLRAAGYEIWWLPEARVQHIIPPERFSWKTQCRLWFYDGCAAAIMRQQQNGSSTARRCCFLSRLLISPLQIVGQIILGSLLLPFSRRSSVRQFLRACRSAGMFYQFWKMKI